MSGNQINRRDFLKIMGWSGAGVALAGCDRPTTVTLHEGKEEVVSYLMPEEYVIPGVGVYYATTCQQCPAGCGIHGRVREGRVLKAEGNPDSPVNYGKLCQMGQAGVQGHYNPDRMTKPHIRKGGNLVEASWDEAMALLKQKVGPDSGLAGDRFAWFTGQVSGHQAVLVNALMDSLGSERHYVHEVVNNAVTRAVNKDMLGVATPRYRIDEAKAILSFGADFLGAGQSPVHYATEYATFRTGDRGVLMVAEPKMSLTGANADLWMAVRPGTEGVLALGIANELVIRHKRKIDNLPAEVRDLITHYDLDTTAQITGVAGDRIVKATQWLHSRTPSLVLAGQSAENQAHGYQIAAATMLLNMVLGNVGRTIVPGTELPFPQLAAKQGGTADLRAFAKAVEQGAYDAVFFYNTNPAYTAPSYMKLAEKLQSKVGFKVVLTQFPDETAKQIADLVLPLHSPFEDWGTHVAASSYDEAVISMQQPLMEPLYPTTRGFGDIVLDVLKMRDSDNYGQYADYYAYLSQAFGALSADWQKTLQTGLLKVEGQAQRINAKAVKVSLPDYKQNAEFPYHLVPSARLGLWDGRHANIPWLQEAPDQISKVVWDSWAEMHPATADKLGVSTGDYITVTSDQGTIETQVYVFNGIHPDVVAVPMGQGHEEYGRYAKGRGVNPLKLISPKHDAKTGELALYGTRVKVAKAGRSEALVRMGGPGRNEAQLGRKLVATVTADVYRRTEGANDVA